MKIDLRSDTITKPSPAMLEAMMQAEVGDDVYDEDPTVMALQDKVAAMLGMEAALFCPTGTMTNQIGIKLLTQPQDEIICYQHAHILKYEAGGLAYHSQLLPKLVEAPLGKIKKETISKSINVEDVHLPRTRLLALENTTNGGGGSYYTIKEISELSRVAKKHDLMMHLDGARLWNAAVASGDNLKEYGKYFDTISVCLSKGLGCPIGSLVLMKKEQLFYAKRLRKVMGGGMRQVGYLAAAGLYALEHNLERMAEDHTRAKAIAESLQKQSYITEMLPTETNIVIFGMQDAEISQRFYQYLREHEVLSGFVSPTHIRLVTHLHFDDHQLDRLLMLIENFA